MILHRNSVGLPSLQICCNGKNKAIFVACPSERLQLVQSGRLRDHVAATELTEAARFWAKLTKSDLPGEPHHPQRIFYYFGVHIKLVLPPAFVLDISPYWERKRAAIECDQSQFVTGRPSEPPTFLDRWRDQAAYWGASIGAAYGEPFASREPVGLTTMTGLV